MRLIEERDKKAGADAGLRDARRELIPDTDCLSFIQIASLLHTLSEKESRKNQRQRQRYQSLNSQLHAYGT